MSLRSRGFDSRVEHFSGSTRWEVSAYELRMPANNCLSKLNRQLCCTRPSSVQQHADMLSPGGLCHQGCLQSPDDLQPQHPKRRADRAICFLLDQEGSFMTFIFRLSPAQEGILSFLPGVFCGFTASVNFGATRQVPNGYGSSFYSCLDGLCDPGHPIGYEYIQCLKGRSLCMLLIPWWFGHLTFISFSPWKKKWKKLGSLRRRARMVWIMGAIVPWII